MTFDSNLSGRLFCKQQCTFCSEIQLTNHPVEISGRAQGFKLHPS